MNRISLILISALAAAGAVNAQEPEMGFEHLEGIDVVVAFDDPSDGRVLEEVFRTQVESRLGVNLLATARPGAVSLVAVASCVPAGCAEPELYSVALLLSNHYDATWALDLLSSESEELAELYAPRLAELMEPLGIWAEAWRPGDYREQISAFVDQLEARCFTPLLARRGIYAALAVGDSARARRLEQAANDERALC